MNPTAIEWTHVHGPGSGFSWNPLFGCTNGCDYCCARRLAPRIGAAIDCEKCSRFEPHLHPERLDDPAKRQKPAGIFVCSMGDAWDPNVPQKWRDQVWEAMHDAPQHTYFMLTKQPQNMPLRDIEAWDATGVWLGVSVTFADDCWRIATLAEIARIQGDINPNLYISCEPLLSGGGFLGYAYLGFEASAHWIQWIIIGADTSPDPSPPEPEWIEQILVAVDEQQVPVFMKDNLADYWPGELRKEWPEGLGGDDDE